jgi:hypothetical protein
MMLANISRFEEVSDLLPILNASIFIDLINIVFFSTKIINSPLLDDWYQTFKLSAVIADVLSIFGGILIARFIYPYFFSRYSLLTFILVVVLVQMSHDILFYLFFSSVPPKWNYMLDFFKKYAKTAGLTAIMGDSVMMIGTCICGSYFATLGASTNIFLLVLMVYITQYLIYQRGP